MPFSIDSLFKILWVVVIGFFSSFAKELNDKAKNPDESLLLFISETLLNGISGAICGTLTFNIIDNIFTASAIAAMGGILGADVVKYIFKILVVYAAAIKSIKISDINKVAIDSNHKDERRYKKNKK